jgi:multisubunit Na+/H+ antiporter MnhE subunit
MSWKFIQFLLFILSLTSSAVCMVIIAHSNRFNIDDGITAITVTLKSVRASILYSTPKIL